MALPIDGDPASLLNKKDYPTLWPSSLPDSPSTAWTRSDGILTTFLEAVGVLNLVSPTNDKDVLNFSDTTILTSSARLIKFLSSAGTRKLSEVLLKNSSNVYESIIDTYVAPIIPTYTYSTNSAPLVTNAQVTSIVPLLVTNGYLLSQTQLYTSSQLATGATAPATDSESLVYLYSLQQAGTITNRQTTLRQTLENKNLRFFGAFLCEYCFYKSRYDLLLSEFFRIYSMPATGTNAYTGPLPNSFIESLFTGPGTGPTEYTLASGKITQTDYLKILGYHLACLNTRMKDMKRILTAVNTYYYGMFDATVLGSNTRLTQTITALQASANDSTGYLAQTDFQKAAMEYNSEKNRYANILLGLYAFLNIAALATVFQLARTS